jgi:hypothetical protein
MSEAPADQAQNQALRFASALRWERAQRKEVRPHPIARAPLVRSRGTA